MTLFGLTAKQIASVVWQSAGRTITSLVQAVIAGATVQTNLATATNMDFRPAVSYNRQITVSMQGATTGVYGLFDGTNFIQAGSLAGAANATFACVGTTSGTGFMFKNTGAGTAIWMNCFADVAIV